jgi:hypothetical protein
MIRVPLRSLPLAGAAMLTLMLAAHPHVMGASLAAQSKSAGAAAGKAQKIDEAYTAKIKEHTTDPRMITELVDHLRPRTPCPRRSSSSAAFPARPTS